MFFFSFQIRHANLLMKKLKVKRQTWQLETVRKAGRPNPTIKQAK
jgi:hypothetical protein